MYQIDFLIHEFDLNLDVTRHFFFFFLYFIDFFVVN